jgi:hypothetical protein
LRWDQVLARRLARHHLAAPVGREDLAAIVGALCGIHAQVRDAAREMGAALLGG